MVTSNKLLDKKVVKMSEQKNNVVVPQRTLLGEVNEHITCPLCHGYYIDATTIVECLHSFCRSCIIKHLQVKSYCPVCEMMINSAKPNIKLDKALQDIVYKLVPGLFQKEMDRRQQFYASRPGPAASATPEQRGEDTERIIFSPEDVISFSLEYADVTDTDSISSKSSDSNEAQTMAAATRRYLQCPAVVNISHLKKFLSNKFDIDSSQFAIDILYKRVPLPDYYTLMDIAYIYNWKRNEPMRFFYQIIDYVAIRNRLFDINRKESHFGDRKSSPTSTEDTNVSSPAPNLNEHVSEGSSGTDSPMPDDNNSKPISDVCKKNNNSVLSQSKELATQSNVGSTTHDNSGKNSCASPKKCDEDEEKSQFLNSFELTAKNSSAHLKTSPVKPNNNDTTCTNESSTVTKLSTSPTKEDNLKRKYQIPHNVPEMKKLKIEIEKAKLTNINTSSHIGSLTPGNLTGKTQETSIKVKPESSSKSGTSPTSMNISTQSVTGDKEDKKDIKQGPSNVKQQMVESTGIKRIVSGIQNNSSISTPKRKTPNESQLNMLPQLTSQKTVSPLKIQVSRAESQQPINKATDVPAASTNKKIPDLKPSPNSTQTFQNKQPINKVRMDLLANNSDIDRSKIMPQLKSSLVPPNSAQPSGDSLRSLFDSCKINIPSSLSITLTDQKLDARNSNEPVNVEQKKNIVNKNLTGAGNAFAHKVPSPPVHNYIEILKLPDTDPKKQNKIEPNVETKLNPSAKVETHATQSKPPSKSSDISAKGPIPNLKPISDTKLGKQSGNFSAPITFQQTFEQQLQSLQSDKKSKLPKNKSQVPKLVPATPKTFSAVGKPNNLNSKPSNSAPAPETKTSSALDLSTTHNIQSQLGPQQTFDKAFERMQSIANLAKKQNLPSKGWALTMSQGNVFSGITSRPLTSGVNPVRVPSTNNVNQIKPEKAIASTSHSNNVVQEVTNKNNPIKSTNNVTSTVSSPNYTAMSHNSPNTQPSPRQTRSPSSSPKLVIAEEKQVSNSSSESNINQSSQLLNLQLPNMTQSKSESSKASLGPSKSGLKPFKPLTPGGKVAAIRQPIPQSTKLNPLLSTSSDYHALIRHQYEMFKAQRQYDIMYKNSIAQSQNDFNNKDKQ